MRVRSAGLPKAQRLVETIGSLVLQSKQKQNALARAVGSVDDVLKHPTPNALILKARKYLDFSNFHCICTVERLNHADRYSRGLNYRDVTALQRLGELPTVPGLVPAAPRRFE
jgi:hypothetical protein